MIKKKKHQNQIRHVKSETQKVEVTKPKAEDVKSEVVAEESKPESKVVAEEDKPESKVVAEEDKPESKVVAEEDKPKAKDLTEDIETKSSKPVKIEKLNLKSPKQIGVVK